MAWPAPGPLFSSSPSRLVPEPAVTDAPRALPPALAAYAARLLAGTGLSAADAARALAGDPEVAVPPGAESVLRVLRDGWSAAMAAGPEPEPELEPGGAA